MDKNIFVTQPSLPPLDEFIEFLKPIWDTGILTNDGPLLQKLEKSLMHKLNATHLSLVTNCTIGLQIAIKALELKGEIITTPFSWVATISAIKWEGCKPIFCDIESDTFNIDPNKIEKLITDKTVAIMPVHVFGVPCNIDAIKEIANKHGLKVIYDAAHAVGSKYNEKCVFEYGDISVTSLHSTKLFNTAEGGACFTTSKTLDDKIKRIKAFGFDDKKYITEDGTNGKMSEIHAALGLANLKYIDDVFIDRKIKYELYTKFLSDCDNIKFQKINYGCTNYSYFPIVLSSEKILLDIINELKINNIFPRRYFYPSLNTINSIVEYKNCPISEKISKLILCLPLYKNLMIKDIENICNIIKRIVNK